jgi:hypothetical protein
MGYASVQWASVKLSHARALISIDGFGRNQPGTSLTSSFECSLSEDLYSHLLIYNLALSTQVLLITIEQRAATPDAWLHPATRFWQAIIVRYKVCLTGLSKGKMCSIGRAKSQLHQNGIAFQANMQLRLVVHRPAKRGNIQVYTFGLIWHLSYPYLIILAISLLPITLSAHDV